MNSKENNMKTLRKLSLWLIGAFFALTSLSTMATAADNVNIDIHVSINASKSVLAGSTWYYFGAIDINTSSNSATPLTINNGSTALIETYTIRGADAISDTAGTNWTLANDPGSTGSENYALAAQFSSARPDNVDGSWANDNLNRLTAVTCTTTVLGDGSAGDEGAGVEAGGERNLYFRLKTPTTTADGGAHTAQLLLSVL